MEGGRFFSSRLTPGNPCARAALVVLAGVCAAIAFGLAAPARAEAYYRGVDVSNWQGSIDWSRVRASGRRFAFAKATEGTSYSDPWYSTNRSGARANRIKFGAYHFARPSGSSSGSIARDAYAEAEFFVAKARLGRGYLRPVLDIEDAGGLSSSNLQYWVRRFLRRVKDRVGAKGIIYTSPSFWETHMGDTTWFAAHGYKVLWIANWGVSSPSVPARNWDGRGWTFWQFTDCGSVPGIEGCVDEDYYRYSRFTRALIR